VLDHASFCSFILRTLLIECPVIPAICMTDNSFLSRWSVILLHLSINEAVAN